MTTVRSAAPTILSPPEAGPLERAGFYVGTLTHCLRRPPLPNVPVVWNLLNVYPLDAAAEVSLTLEGVGVFAARDRIEVFMFGRDWKVGILGGGGGLGSDPSSCQAGPRLPPSFPDGLLSCKLFECIYF